MERGNANEVNMTTPNSTPLGGAGLLGATHRDAKSILPAMFRSLIAAALLIATASLTVVRTQAQDAPPQPAQSSFGAPVSLTLKRAIELALQNSKDIQVARLQTTLADRSAWEAAHGSRPCVKLEREGAPHVGHARRGG